LCCRAALIIHGTVAVAIAVAHAHVDADTDADADDDYANADVDAYLEVVTIQVLSVNLYHAERPSSDSRVIL